MPAGWPHFLDLDEVDAGLTALAGGARAVSTGFACRAGTVMVVTTIHVIATMSFSGILEPDHILL